MRVDYHSNIFQVFNVELMTSLKIIGENPFLAKMTSFINDVLGSSIFSHNFYY